jgi:hypothetical protein
LLGLLFQLKDAFPQHREIRKAIVFVITGVFVGSLVTSFLKGSVSVSVPLSGYGLLLLGLGGVIFFCLMVAASTSDATKRDSFFAASGLGTFAFLLVAFFGSIMSQDMERRFTLNKNISLDEYLELADHHASKRNFDRAIELLDRAPSSGAARARRWLVGSCKR